MKGARPVKNLLQLSLEVLFFGKVNEENQNDNMEQPINPGFLGKWPLKIVYECMGNIMIQYWVS